jgi:glutamine synthetase
MEMGMDTICHLQSWIRKFWLSLHPDNSKALPRSQSQSLNKVHETAMMDDLFKDSLLSNYIALLMDADWMA